MTIKCTTSNAHEHSVQEKLESQHYINIYNNASMRFLNSQTLEEVIQIIEESMYMLIKPDLINVLMEFDGVYTCISSSNLDHYTSLLRIEPPYPPIIEKLLQDKLLIYIEDLAYMESLIQRSGHFVFLEDMTSVIFVPLIIKYVTGGLVTLAFEQHLPCNRVLMNSLSGIMNLASLTIERINYIEEQEKMKTLLNKSEKLTSMGRIVAGVAHEINNPLSILQLDVNELLFMIQEKGSLEGATEVALSMQEEINRISSIVIQLKDYYRPSGLVDELVCLDTIIKDYPIKVLLKNIKKKNVKVSISLNCSGKFVTIPRNRIIQVLMNIINNAFDALNGKQMKRISIETFTTLRQDNIQYVAIKIKDNGMGISNDIQDRIFEPFFTTKKSDGTGLGLSISQSIINTYQGVIEVHSHDGEGTEFIIYLPEGDRDKRILT